MGRVLHETHPDRECYQQAKFQCYISQDFFWSNLKNKLLRGVKLPNRYTRDMKNLLKLWSHILPYGEWEALVPTNQCIKTVQYLKWLSEIWGWRIKHLKLRVDINCKLLTCELVKNIQQNREIISTSRRASIKDAMISLVKRKLVHTNPVTSLASLLEYEAAELTDLMK